ncbi:6-phosphogluconolactonase [Albimonas donghaensis]|uniref:Glucose-6-phosphate isomerase n=1 Tax=Albimonas donghaensis TaxID=356660 RepID=A0A1H2VC88_9RHOB|nr:6-phosphogluconolactonase [Albimonas donghaensis]
MSDVAVPPAPTPLYELRRYDDADALADAAAARIAELLQGALSARGRAVAALSGGATPQRAYAKLSRAKIDWPRVSVTLVDDLWAPASDPRSNKNLLDLTLFYDGGASGARFAPLYTGGASVEAGCAAAEAALRPLARPFDLVVLGMGPDGHVASFFPGGDRLSEALDPDGRALLTPMRAPGLPGTRISLTLAAILQARRILLLFSGRTKARTFQRALGPGPVEDMPIRAILRQRRAPVEVLCADIDGADVTPQPIAAAWKAVETARDRLAGRRIVDLFDTDPERFERLSARAEDMLLDLSKTGLDAGALEALLNLARAAGVETLRDAMFEGRPINATEGRPVLHAALRARPGDVFAAEGVDVMPEVLETRARALDFAEAVRSGAYAAADGGRFTDVVNIGIGGSDLGPVMAVRALAPVHDGPRCHFISNVDGAHAQDVLRTLDPARTLVLIASKTFTTIETMTNADTAMRWMKAGVGEAAGGHFAAISTALDKVEAFGIDPARAFGFWDWVGGRYSVWSSIGLSLMIAIGRADFEAFLDGGRAMDAHFRTAPLDKNLPVLLAAAGVWHRNALGLGSRAVIPYDQRLERLPAYLQQLDMESNGKTARLRDGLPGETGPVVWGEPGTNGQHAFFQLLHQGTTVIPVEFLVAATGWEPELAHHHSLLLANCFAQSEALMAGRSEQEAHDMMIAEGMEAAEARRLAPHRAFSGDRPSTMLIYRKLDPYTLGRLVALYEHRVFSEGVIWGVNAYDQWGVELGKTLAKALEPMVTGEASAAEKDGSTIGLIGWMKALQSG